MNTTIESLKELYAKLGGSLEDVENITTIPEMIDAISEVAGGDEPTYETVAEIQVGTMVGGDGQYSFTATNVTVPTIDTSATYYLNNSENPSSNVKLVEGNPFFLFNAADPDDFHPEDPSKPLVGLAYNGQEQTCLVLSDTPDLSNTTVRILKKVEQGGSELPEVTSADNGDVLTVVDGAWAKAEPSVLPTYDTTEDLGKVLTVTADGLAWVTPT